MTDVLSLPSARVCMLQDVASKGSAAVGSSVRVTGEVKLLGPSRAQLLLYDRGCSLWADISEAAVQGEPRQGAMLQLVGELVAHRPETEARLQPSEGQQHATLALELDGAVAPPPLLLKARIARLMEGLDLELYSRCLAMRRRFEEEYLPIAG
eukprot:TRINITY_DN48547_c0_g1_i1.p1 TRINITY_DN48547_c0_g1~~TRINITY_DN48547_c0_g1_i1.p1  ORF type:complete len:153 (+),score=22.45 TRINITY_DN48547_c0_g1_i1:96-554(+)